jgi:hypothetical protein
VIRPLELERTLPWVLRLAWVGVVVFGGGAIDGAVSERSQAVRALALGGGGVAWLIGVAAMAVPAVVSLTATRVIVALAVPVAVVAWIAGSNPVDATLFLGVALMATVVAFSADLGRAFVQASAYGEEDRHPLRAPAAYAMASAVAWIFWAACTISGPLLLAARAWVPGTLLTAGSIALAVWSWPRWNRLARRWFVVVPVGVVVHDPLVLGETLMLRRHEIAGIHLAPVGTTAADLTGPAAGHALEIVTSEAVTAIIGATRREPRGTTIHLTACLVAPSRPGRALRSADERRLAVG